VFDGEVVVCTLGDEAARQVIKDALAKGADRGIFISSEKINNNDPLLVARTIAETIKSQDFDLVLSGLQSNDNGHSQVGILIAELLNTSHASLVMGTEILNNKTIKVKQELENGWFQWSELDFPASLTIQSGINSPRYATLKGIMSVKNKTVDSFDSNKDITSEYNLTERFVPQKSKETVVIEGNADDIANDLADILKNKIKVI
jgi:electron transfer flavoprotein beta subunit